jgi:hypothetical protein
VGEASRENEVEADAPGESDTGGAAVAVCVGDAVREGTGEDVPESVLGAVGEAEGEPLPESVAEAVGARLTVPLPVPLATAREDAVCVEEGEAHGEAERLAPPLRDTVELAEGERENAAEGVAVPAPVPLVRGVPLE